jgi:hypothetical protein
MILFFSSLSLLHAAAAASLSLEVSQETPQGGDIALDVATAGASIADAANIAAGVTAVEATPSGIRDVGLNKPEAVPTDAVGTMAMPSVASNAPAAEDIAQG